MSAEEETYLAELSTLTGMSASEWRDFLSLSPEEQAAVAGTYRDMDWIRSPDVLGKVLSVLGALGEAAASVTNISGAIGAIRAAVAGTAGSGS